MPDVDGGCDEGGSTMDPTAVQILAGPRPTTAGSQQGDKMLRRQEQLATGRKSRSAYTFYAVNYGQQNHKLGEVYSALANHLHKHRADWNPTSGMQSCHLVLGEAQAAGVHWAKLGISRVKPLVNFYRGFQTLCRKTMMAQSLRSHAILTRTSEVLDRFLPKTFIFTKKHQERTELIQEYRRRRQEGLENTWILKPSGGAHGDNIVVMNKEEDILRFLDEQQQSDAGIAPWVVQKYLDRPLLLPGGRKFDVRCMVLVTHDYSIYLYSQGILRSCSVKFSLDDLSDRFVHLANHCLQVHHPDYGKHEDLNLLTYADFDKFLCESGHLGSDGRPVRLETHILPQIEAQVVYSLQSVKDQMEVQDNANYRCFNLLGFDFMMDDQYNVYLIEVNSSPTTDPRLIPQLVEEVLKVAVDTVFPPLTPVKEDIATDSSKTELHARDAAFKLIHSPCKCQRRPCSNDIA